MSFPETGFVLRVIRERNEVRGIGTGARYRTIGKYECYFNGFRLVGPELSGATAEPRGPGNNSSAGVSRGLRIAEGRYQFGTHNGGRYATFFAGTQKKPALYVHDTETRTFILVHPGSGFKSTVGCINLTGSLVGPGDDISSTISRNRVEKLIEAIRDRMGANFPTSTVGRLENAWLVVEGEP